MKGVDAEPAADSGDEVQDGFPNALVAKPRLNVDLVDERVPAVELQTEAQGQDHVPDRGSSAVDQPHTTQSLIIQDLIQRAAYEPLAEGELFLDVKLAHEFQHN